MPDKLKGRDLRIIAVEPTACPTLTRGLYAYDFGDTEGLTPLIMMYTLGHSFVPPGIHAGGLRFEAAQLFARTEGIIPAPETAHAIKAAVDEAVRCRETNDPKCIVFNFSGHGHFDLSAYDAFLEGNLEDMDYPEEVLARALGTLPKVPGS